MEGITPGLTESTPTSELPEISDRRWALDHIALIALGLAVVQVSTASMWWTAAYGIPILVTDALLAAGLLAGVFAERIVTRVAGAVSDSRVTRAVRTAFGLLASVGWVLVAAVCVTTATTTEPSWSCVQ